MDADFGERPAIVFGATTGKGNVRIGQILDAAKDILVEEGFAEISFRSIAKRVGMTVGNVSYYFPTKEKLMKELATYIFERWDAGFRRRVPKDLTDGMAIFDYSIRYMIEQNKRGPTNALLIEMWSMASRSDAVMGMMDVFYGKMRAWIEDMLADIDPHLPAPTRRLNAAVITCQIEGLMILIGPRRIPHDELRGIEDRAVEYITSLACATAQTPARRAR